MKPLLLSLLLALAPLSICQTTPEAEVAAVHREFQKDWKNSDAGGLDRLMADDLTWIGALGGGPREKAAVLQGFKARRMTIPQKEEAMKVRVFGDVGIVTFATANQDVGNPGASIKLLMTEVWAKGRSGWKLVSFHSSLAERPAAR